ncbi:D-2-hydroxyacid dehydrogenase [Marasmitruncus massiliensis]|uniref:D-2-hydroxyacid dehydrogenase n=1 Tax=Marasmitruncus massiliensis TaxID=1944642 RepID=UPI000C7DE6B0|nr:D-2-hydroxyacid dehydrogenase [Marasmitruncus massiliensis]
MKIVILDGHTENPGDLSWEGFERLGRVTVYDRTQENQIVERIGDAQAVIVNKTPLSRETLSACPSIKYIGVLATGYNVVDVAAAKEKNIPVCNIPTYGTTAVAQFTFALLLEICHHVGAHDLSVHEGDWASGEDWCYWNYPLMELAGKTMGIIGFGRIGQNVARIAKAFGMRILAVDDHPCAAGTELAEYVGLDELLSESDVISLHCPLFSTTEGMINKNTVAKMKNGVILLNTSRGPLVVEQDLADALNSGKIYAAGLDVVSTEPIKADNVLLSAKNCFLTPHIAWAPKESRQRLMDIAVANLQAFIDQNPINVVNP